MRFFVLSRQTLCRYGCMYFLAALLLVCGDGMSAVYMLNSVGEMTPPCGTPVLN